MELRREKPERSIGQIIFMLEEGDIALRGEIAPSTLSRHFKKAGLSREELLKDTSGSKGYRRFEAEDINILWQSDFQHTLYIPDSYNPGKKKKAMLFAIIDDFSRFLVHFEFYFDERLPRLEDSFKKAILKHGVPEQLYVDNGAVFSSTHLAKICAKLGERNRGKVERFNATVEEFMQEIALEKPKTLEELNRKFRIWLDEGYNNSPHSSLNNDTPMQAYQANPRKVRFATPEECRDAFLWEETRKVDSTGCFRLNGLEYEAGIEYISKKVDVRYDPFDRNLVEIWYNGERKKTVTPLSVGEFCGQVEKMPALVKATHSRLLKVYEVENSKRQKKTGALSFKSMKEDDGNV